MHNYISILYIIKFIRLVYALSYIIGIKNAISYFLL